MLSIFYCDKFIYHYPNSKEQLSEDLKNYFPQGWFGKFKIIDCLATENRFSVKFNGRTNATINAFVQSKSDGLKLEVNLNANSLLFLIVYIIFFTVICLLDAFPNSLVAVFFFISFFCLFTIAEYFTKKSLKKHFEEHLGLPCNNEIVEKSFNWL
jgi:uncharacterized membrane protein